MPYQASVYRVFIASPSDVQEERQAVQEVLASWNCLHSKEREIVLLPVRWESHAYPASGNTPQAILNEQLLKDADLLVGVFWTRLGTPTDEYRSGTVEEYERHTKSGKPAMLYFSQKPIPHDHDQEQFQRLRDFKQKFIDDRKGLYRDYANLDDFQNNLLTCITLCVNDDAYFCNTKKLNTPVDNSGVIYIQDRNSLQMLDKSGTRIPVASLSPTAKIIVPANNQPAMANHNVINSYNIAGNSGNVAIRSSQVEQNATPTTAKDVTLFDNLWCIVRWVLERFGVKL